MSPDSPTNRTRRAPPRERPTPPRPLVITVRGMVATALLLLVCALCVRLGFWQLERRAQRQALNAALAQRALDAPVVAAERLRDTTGIVFRAARLRGRYDHGGTIILPGRSRAGAPGVHLLTPFQLDDAPHALLVNRGWVPAADGVTVDLAHFDGDTTRLVDGLLLPLPASTGAYGADRGNAFRRVWYSFDERALRDQYPYPLAALQLQLVDDGSRTDAPLPLPRPQLDEGPHLGYAIQWFSFALIGVVGWGVLVFRSGYAQRVERPLQLDE